MALLLCVLWEHKEGILPGADLQIIIMIILHYLQKQLTLQAWLIPCFRRITKCQVKCW